ncbi:hypothetical protein AB205_0161780 [Aquarana catesbeiana]|uniref:Uncharacterized protein n=1 Tax=Aquarana catesbeiana TaxID=8400 RepID=A0A2G9NDD9_AQUCT|nr:hypothetical protein AB205_0161780 [Aquarana catesbeiana]
MESINSFSPMDFQILYFTIYAPYPVKNDCEMQGCNQMSACPLLHVSLLWRSTGCSKITAMQRHFRYTL